MKTTVKPADLTDMEPDFAKPCGGYEDCPHEASWAVWCSHGLLICPIDTYICDACKELAIAHWTINVRNHKVCFRCKVGITGQLSDHLRFIKL